MISSTVKEYKEIRKALKPLLEGVVLSIDPSCGSKGEQGSLPGWAVSYKGELVDSGTIALPVEEDLYVRLRSLHHGMRQLMKQFQPDVLVYENIAPRRYGGGSAHSHASLLKAVGVTLSVSGPDIVIGLKPSVWTKWKRSTYVKSDEADAVEMLWIAIETAREIEVADPPRGYGGVGKTKKKVTKAAEILHGEASTGTHKQGQAKRRRTTSRRKSPPTIPPF